MGLSSRVDDLPAKWSLLYSKLWGHFSVIPRESWPNVCSKCGWREFRWLELGELEWCAERYLPWNPTTSSPSFYELHMWFGWHFRNIQLAYLCGCNIVLSSLSYNLWIVFSRLDTLERRDDLLPKQLVGDIRNSHYHPWSFLLWMGACRRSC